MVKFTGAGLLRAIHKGPKGTNYKKETPWEVIQRGSEDRIHAAQLNTCLKILVEKESKCTLD